MQVAKSDSRILYLDLDSIRLDDGFKVAWTKYVYFSGENKEFKSLDLYNCQAMRTAMRMGVAYKRDGTSSSATARDYELRWEEVVPDTLGEAAFKAVCH
jgi:hypothetical protein